jgi:arylformamidase
MRTILLLLLLVPVAGAQTLKSNIPYAEPANERQMLDVYTPAKGTNLPVVLWIHGGGWQTGDKTSVQQKPQAFTGRGFIFVSINHRFVTKELFKFLDPLVGVNR